MHKAFLRPFIEHLKQFPQQAKQAMAAIKACQRHELKAWRFEQAGIDLKKDAKAMGPSEDLLVAIEFLCPEAWENENFAHDLLRIHQVQGHSDDEEAKDVVKAWLRLCEKLPYRWLYAQFQTADEAIKSLLPGILKHRNKHYDLSLDAISWLAVQAEIEDAWLAFAQGDFSPKRLPKVLNEAQRQSKTLLSSLKKLALNQSKWAKDLIQTSAQASIDRDILEQSPELYITCRAEAWRQNAMPGRGISEILNNISTLKEKPLVHLQRAKLHLDQNEFGQALHCLEACERLLPPKAALNKNIIEEKQRLASQALRLAMSAPSLQPPLLELALKYGKKESFTKAALCFYDAQLDDEILSHALSKNATGRKTWALEIARRRDTEKLDKLHRISLKLSHLEDNSTLLLDALSKLDNPNATAQSLERILKKALHWFQESEKTMKDGGEVSPSALFESQASEYAADPLKSADSHDDSSEDIEIYWESAHLWVQTHARLQDFDAGIRGVLPYFVSQKDKRRAQALLQEIISCIPREALPMLQESLISSLGLDESKALFEGLIQSARLDRRIRTQIDGEEGAKLGPAYLRSAFFLSLPLAWQLAQNLSLLTQGKAGEGISPSPKVHIQEQAFQAAPAPPTWELRKSHKASDAFDD